MTKDAEIQHAHIDKSEVRKDLIGYDCERQLCMSDNYIVLKWGTLKSWSVSNACVPIVKRWAALGYSLSAMDQHDTPEQKELLCELIREHDGEISNDWTGEKMTKDEAMKYIREYDT